MMTHNDDIGDCKKFLIEEHYQIPLAMISVDLLHLYYKTMYFVSMMNTFYK